MKRTETKTKTNPARQLPSVGRLLELPAAAALLDRHGHPQTADALRSVLQERRQALLANPALPAGTPESLLEAAAARLEAGTLPRLRPVINATGIILHTGLGRAVLPRAAVDALARLTGPCNVQMDLDTGERSRREACVRELVRTLTGAPDVLVVNNNAGATMLVLRALAAGREVIVSRGELIEIGGEFRLPDIMRESGATMREVGATNKTHLSDYQQALQPGVTGLLFKAHKSNYAIVGFTAEVGIAELAALGRAQQVPAVDDLGCGALVPLERYGLPHEMTVRESLAAGADVVLFSTDKLIGGPQGALIVGRPELLDRMRSHPLYRALRVCKLTLTALEATLRLFLDPARLHLHHPTYTMLARPLAELRGQAEALAARVRAAHPDWTVAVVDEPSYLGGGAVPASSLPSIALSLAAPCGTEALARSLRHAPVPVIPHTRQDAVLVNLRTVLAAEADSLQATLCHTP